MPTNMKKSRSSTTTSTVYCTSECFLDMFLMWEQEEFLEVSTINHGNLRDSLSRFSIHILFLHTAQPHHLYMEIYNGPENTTQHHHQPSPFFYDFFYIFAVVLFSTTHLPYMEISNGLWEYHLMSSPMIPIFFYFFPYIFTVFLFSCTFQSPPPIPAGLAGVLQDSSGLCRIASQSFNIGSQSCQAWQSWAELGRAWQDLCRVWQDLT